MTGGNKMSSDTGGLFAEAGWNGLFSIVVTLGFVTVAWIILNEVAFDKFVKNPRTSRARVLQLLLAIVLGHSAARFVLDYWAWTGAVKWLFSAS
jgi:uncharacterized integral membrane protein (TIGR02327 family)